MAGAAQVKVVPVGTSTGAKSKLPDAQRL